MTPSSGPVSWSTASAHVVLSSGLCGETPSGFEVPRIEGRRLGGRACSIESAGFGFGLGLFAMPPQLEEAVARTSASEPQPSQTFSKP